MPKIELLTTKQLAAALQVKVDTIRIWARAGKIPEIRVSCQVRRYDLAEVLRVLRERQAGMRESAGADHRETIDAP